MMAYFLESAKNLPRISRLLLGSYWEYCGDSALWDDASVDASYDAQSFMAAERSRLNLRMLLKASWNSRQLLIDVGRFREELKRPETALSPIFL